jgi:hypothetical protein
MDIFTSLRPPAKPTREQVEQVTLGRVIETGREFEVGDLDFILH